MITVLGGSGFVGSNMVKLLHNNNIPFSAPKRDKNLADRNLGHVIYCIGLTADFRFKPFETVEAHICKLKEVLELCEFTSLTYLSSTRVYLKSSSSTGGPLTEDEDIRLNPNDPFDLFAATKITGESLALNSNRPNIKIARLSNVFGLDFNSENFITSIVKDIVKSGKVELFTTSDSEKDYISVEDVCEALLLLSALDDSGIYNLSFGKNTSNQEIVEELRSLTGAEIVYSSDARKHSFPEIDNSKLGNRINFFPKQRLLDSLPKIVDSFRTIGQL